MADYKKPDVPPPPAPDADVTRGHLTLDEIQKAINSPNRVVATELTPAPPKAPEGYGR